MLLVPKLERVIPSPMDHPHHAQCPNLCCAKAHPQLHNKTATASSNSIKTANCLDQLYAQVQQHKFSSSLEKPRTFATFINVSATFKKPHSTRNIFLLKNLATLAKFFFLKTLQHLQPLKSTATPAKF